MAVAQVPEFTPAGPVGPVGVVAEARAEISDLVDTLWSARTDGELVGVVEQLAGLKAVIAAVEAGAVAETDLRGIAKTQLHYGSTGDWLTHLGGMRRGQGRRVVVRAHALTTTLEATRQGLVDGVLSPEQADVILATVETLPTSPVLRAKGEAILVDHAGSLDATELAKTGRHLVEVIDPDAEDRRLERELERATHHARFLRIRDDGAGGVWVKGRGSVEDGAILKAALLPLTCPEPGVDEYGDAAPDPRDGGARMWDALIQTAQHALDTDLPPQTHGARPRVAVTLDYDTLVGHLADTGVIAVGGVTEDGLELPAEVVRRLACDADLIPAVLGSQGEVLDVGRVYRLVTAALWVALVLRDRHCTFPGCNRPPVMCHAHHIIHWVHGGRTKLWNLALLCGHHHRIIHNTPWEIRINPDDGTPEFLPPPKPGRKPEWIRQRPRIEQR